MIARRSGATSRLRSWLSSGGVEFMFLKIGILHNLQPIPFEIRRPCRSAYSPAPPPCSDFRASAGGERVGAETTRGPDLAGDDSVSKFFPREAIDLARNGKTRIWNNLRAATHRNARAPPLPSPFASPEGEKGASHRHSRLGHRFLFLIIRISLIIPPHSFERRP
jgi:hypothetical protein